MRGQGKAGQRDRREKEGRELIFPNVKGQRERNSVAVGVRPKPIRRQYKAGRAEARGSAAQSTCRGAVRAAPGLREEQGNRSRVPGKRSKVTMSVRASVSEPILPPGAL